jgi:peroxiredoxin
VCNHEAPSVEAASSRWAGTVHFVGVAWAGDEQMFQAFVDRYHLDFPQVSDAEGAVYARFGVPAQPALVVIDRRGAVHTMFGAVKESVLDDLLTAATA